MLTGESVPVDKTIGDTVVGASINTAGVLTVRATAVGQRTALAQIAAQVAAAQAGKGGAQRLADRVSAVFVPSVIGIAAATFLGWWLFAADPIRGLTAAVAVVVVACPCALGLATPVAIMVGTGRGAKLGILVKGLEVLERTRTITTVIFDKTGTLTEGRMILHEIVPAAGTTCGELLTNAGAVEADSQHPIGQAIATAARDARGRLPAVTGFEALTGHGVRADVDGITVWVGRRMLADDASLTLPAELGRAADGLEADGKTVVFSGWDGVVRGLLAVGDSIKDGAAEVVAELRRMGLEVGMITGDTASAARAIASRVGIDTVLGEVLPGDKQSEIRRIQSTGQVVAMVGDGINDAPALTQADLGIALGTGTDVAIEASDITLMSGQLDGVVRAIHLSRRTLRTIYQNLGWAFGYNVAAIPLAALGLLNPVVAGAAMGLSSVSVVANSSAATPIRSPGLTCGLRAEFRYRVNTLADNRSGRSHHAAWSHHARSHHAARSHHSPHHRRHAFAYKSSHFLGVRTDGLYEIWIICGLLSDHPGGRDCELTAVSVGAAEKCWQAAAHAHDFGALFDMGIHAGHVRLELRSKIW